VDSSHVSGECPSGGHRAARRSMVRGRLVTLAVVVVAARVYGRFNLPRPTERRLVPATKGELSDDLCPASSTSHALEALSATAPQLSLNATPGGRGSGSVTGEVSPGAGLQRSGGSSCENTR
jgi:hypothetical protein